MGQQQHGRVLLLGVAMQKSFSLLVVCLAVILASPAFAVAAVSSDGNGECRAWYVEETAVPGQDSYRLQCNGGPCDPETRECKPRSGRDDEGSYSYCGCGAKDPEGNLVPCCTVVLRQTEGGQASYPDTFGVCWLPNATPECKEYGVCQLHEYLGTNPVAIRHESMCSF